MNKSISLLILVLLFVTLKSSSQNKKNDSFTNFAQYKLSYKPDSLQSKVMTEYMVLMFNQKISGFRSTARYVRDSIMATAAFNNKSMPERMSIMQRYNSKIEEYIITDLENKEITYTTVAKLSTYVYPQYTEKITHTWVITKETKKIQGILCTRAETNRFGRRWIAWFSNEHPFPFGPYKFYGLPGLILELSDTTGSYVYELHNLRKRNITYPRNPDDNIIKVSKLKSIELYNTGRYTLAMFKDAKIEGRGPEYPKKLQDILDKQRRSENNPIELKP